MMRYRIIFVTVSLMVALATEAAYRGAEIRYAPVTGMANTYTISVDLYRSLNGVDRPEIILDLGDGTIDTVPRTTLQDFDPANDCGPIRLSTYQVAHTYPGAGNYTIRFEAGNRGSGVLNIPNSIGQGACIEALLVIDPALGPNASISFDTLQFVTRQNWNTLIHDPGAQDADGDSLAFELLPPMGTGCVPITGYQFPEGANYTWLNPENGIYLWEYPPFSGEWSIALRGSEYRNGQLIGQVTRDMYICVVDFIIGINSIERDNDLTLFPTLTQDLFTIQNRRATTYELVLLGANGSIVSTFRVPTGASTISVEHLVVGVYTLRASGADGSIRTFRIAKY